MIGPVAIKFDKFTTRTNGVEGQASSFFDKPYTPAYGQTPLRMRIQDAVKIVVERASITKRVGCHTFRHCFATHLLENGVNIRQIQELKY